MALVENVVKPGFSLFHGAPDVNPYRGGNLSGRVVPNVGRCIFSLVVVIDMSAELFR
jgi:hypothetical protein